MKVNSDDGGPDVTVPAGAVVMVAVMIFLCRAFYTDDWKTAAIIGGIGTVSNFTFFLNRVFLQARAQVDELRRFGDLKHMEITNRPNKADHTDR